jgi:phosphoserine phosphatase RsbU/P
MFTPSQRFRSVAADVPVERRLRDMESLLSVTRAIAAEPDLTRLLVLLAREASKVLQVQRTSLWLIDSATGELFTRVAEGVDAIRVPAGAGIVGSVAASGDFVAIPDAYKDSRFNPEVDKKTGFHTKEILCVPLYGVEDHRVIGVLQALNKTDGETITPYDIELALLVSAQAGVALEQAGMREYAAEMKRLQAEMNLARSIQQRLLPRESPKLPALDVAGINRAASETSGDYFDYVQLPDDRFGVIIADVTGHGLGAALIMTAARAFLRALCESDADPSRIAMRGNNLLEKDLENGNFLSLCLAAFSPDGRTLHYISAGHEPPLVYRPSAKAFATLDSTGPLLGILPGAEFALGGPLDLQKDDVLLFMTDGLFECMNQSDETFGIERVKDALEPLAANSAQEILNGLLAATDAWANGVTQRDDITLVVVKVR